MSNLDPKIVDLLMTASDKVMKAVSPLIVIGTSNKWPFYRGIAKGIIKIKRSTKIITDSEILGLNPAKYKDLVESHDLLISLEAEHQKPVLSYLPLDLRNQGAYLIGHRPIYHPFLENFDIYMIMDPPGLFPHLIRMMERWSPPNEEIDDQNPRDKLLCSLVH